MYLHDILSVGCPASEPFSLPQKAERSGVYFGHVIQKFGMARLYPIYALSTLPRSVKGSLGTDGNNFF